MKTKKILALILVLAITLGFAACTSSDEDKKTNETRIIKDVKDREVTLPVNVKTIVCLGSGATRIAAYLNVTDMIVGAEKNDAENLTVLRDYNPVYHDKLKSLPIVGDGGGSGNNNANPEAIIMLAPDVILAAFEAEAAEELQSQTGIPVVSVRYISTGLANDTFYSAMRVFAEVTGTQKRCEEVLHYINGLKADLNSRTSDIPEGGKLRAYAGAVTFSGQHGFAGTYSRFGPFVAINALNVADEIDKEGYYETDFEKIAAWDPDVIFLDPGNMHLVNEEYNTNPSYFNSLRAINENRVYSMPSFNNCGTNITYALMNAYYAGIILFPARFDDINIAEKSGEILNFFLGKNTFDAMKDGGLYYGEINNLGE